MNKVLILDLAVRGGSTKYAKEIEKRLSCDHDIVISSSYEEKLAKEYNAWKTHENAKQFVLLTITKLPVYLFRIRRKLAGGEYGTLYLPYIHYWSLFFVLLFKLYKKNVVVTIHDGVNHAKNGRSLIQWMVNQCMKRADKIIFLSEYVKKAVEENSKLKSRNYVVPHGLLDNSGFGKDRKGIDGKATLLFFGKVLKSKGVEMFLDAARDIDDLVEKIYIVGKHYYPLEIEENEKVCVINKHVDNEEMAMYFNRSDILVVPYKEASQSGVVTLGISACIPMVVTNVGGLGEQVGNEREGLVVEPNKTDLSAGLKELILNKSLYSNIVENLIEREGGKEWNDIAEAIDQILARLRLRPTSREVAPVDHRSR